MSQAFAGKIQISGTTDISFTALTDGATIALNMSLADAFTVTLGGSRELSNPTGETTGQMVLVRLVQDATGGRLVTFGSEYTVQTNAGVKLKTAANAVDYIVIEVVDGTHMTVTQKP